MKRTCYAFIIIGGICLATGILGFLTGMFASFGALNWVPSSFEMPLGHLDDIAVDEYGNIYCALQFYSRVQVYDRDGRFLRGWPVNPPGGAFQIRAKTSGQIEITTVREDLSVFTPEGQLIEYKEDVPGYWGEFEREADDYRRNQDGSTLSVKGPIYNRHVVRVPPSGETKTVICTPWYLWLFAGPMPVFLLMPIGMLLIFVGSSANKLTRVLSKPRPAEIRYLRLASYLPFFATLLIGGLMLSGRIDPIYALLKLNGDYWEVVLPGFQTSSSGVLWGDFPTEDRQTELRKFQNGNWTTVRPTEIGLPKGKEINRFVLRDDEFWGITDNSIVSYGNGAWSIYRLSEYVDYPVPYPPKEEAVLIDIAVGPSNVWLLDSKGIVREFRGGSWQSSVGEDGGMLLASSDGALWIFGQNIIKIKDRSLLQLPFQFPETTSERGFTFLGEAMGSLWFQDTKKPWATLSQILPIVPQPNEQLFRISLDGTTSQLIDIPGMKKRRNMSISLFYETVAPGVVSNNNELIFLKENALYRFDGRELIAYQQLPQLPKSYRNVQRIEALTNNAVFIITELDQGFISVLHKYGGPLLSALGILVILANLLDTILYKRKHQVSQ